MKLVIDVVTEMWKINWCAYSIDISYYDDDCRYIPKVEANVHMIMEQKKRKGKWEGDREERKGGKK